MCCDAKQKSLGGNHSELDSQLSKAAELWEEASLRALEKASDFQEIRQVWKLSHQEMSPEAKVWCAFCNRISQLVTPPPEYH